MEFVKLRYLIAVAEQRSFSKAAEKCFVSQPTLTRCVQNMEKSLGVSLFDRSCSPIQLTPVGEKYVAGVREILALKEKLDNEMAELTDRRQEVLSIGIPLTRSITWLGRILPAFYAQCPGVKLQITEGYSGELTKKLLEGEITFCLMACSSSQVKGVTLRPVYQEEMMLVIDRNADALQGVDFPPRERARCNTSRRACWRSCCLSAPLPRRIHGTLPLTCFGAWVSSRSESWRHPTPRWPISWRRRTAASPLRRWR